MQQLVTYAPSYSLLGVSKKEFKERIAKPLELFRVEETENLVSDFSNILIYDDEADKYYNVSLEESRGGAVPVFADAKELK